MTNTTPAAPKAVVVAAPAAVAPVPAAVAPVPVIAAPAALAAFRAMAAPAASHFDALGGDFYQLGGDPTEVINVSAYKCPEPGCNEKWYKFSEDESVPRCPKHPEMEFQPADTDSGK